jgi:hypothetical protein
MLGTNSKSVGTKSKPGGTKSNYSGTKSKLKPHFLRRIQPFQGLTPTPKAFS